ncbi:hypothetical protein [Aeromonas veronii]|uniref:hypothetical protein n=1 Tax=Aeromonas TaxID=642 RepID=UPI001D09AB8B|nr:hypothetical protein [Aeromonas veronii]MCX4045207.1 hypothetical protein [Aeromonas veronii]UDN24587.1 hypothetical protein LEO77_08775 [Aeromonas veronii]
MRLNNHFILHSVESIRQPNNRSDAIIGASVIVEKWDPDREIALVVKDSLTNSACKRAKRFHVAGVDW